ncbi:MULTISPECIES: hypothetical protein [unclassified Methylophaga]|jgi:hypothetical protein|uniref:hypothetical protein n=1 Tax=unclassified Methylophaga TaxID=2629249 RepID=UPI000C8E8256|nr:MULTISPECIES: hypothetical protein [unclassified Methylophaga]MAK67944.1 hypothetical protein [Methylophaga sp.]MAY16719.1 hypothetical protein [Methylophaga sp.]HAO23935.1 hypothetical protein [Methylophaga sp.]HCD06266.1 hypothetical protein [Methylophaga sp.]|tara:strand:+ start:10396 stop:11511 length:1116 start_codon:yes stop_codon:yes gene_type:complete
MDRARTGSTIVAAILAVIVLLLFGYLLWSDAPPNRSELTVDPPIEVIEPDLPLEIIRSAEELPDSETIREQEAEEFVDRLADSNSDSIIVNEYEDMFVRPDSIIALPELEQRVTTLKSLMDDKSLSANTPLTLRYTEQISENTTLQELEAEEEDHIAPVTIVTEQGETITAPLVELLKRDDIDHTAPVTQIRQQKQVRQIKASELADADIPADQEMSVTISRGVQKLDIADLIDSDTAEMQDSLFYLHRVTEEDVQGLWGIIQTGLIRNFRQGIRLQRNGAEQNVSVLIPADADEPLPTGLSSFLGKILHQKVSTSYVYNFNTHTMGYDPNIIHPGQELILIRFSGEELKDIYQFFAEQKSNTTETFAIGR